MTILHNFSSIQCLLSTRRAGILMAVPPASGPQWWSSRHSYQRSTSTYTVSQPPCTALIAGNLPAVRAGQETVSGLLKITGIFHLLHEATMHCSYPEYTGLICTPYLYLDKPIWSLNTPLTVLQPPDCECGAVFLSHVWCQRLIPQPSELQQCPALTQMSFQWKNE